MESKPRWEAIGAIAGIASVLVSLAVWAAQGAGSQPPPSPYPYTSPVAPQPTDSSAPPTPSTPDTPNTTQPDSPSPQPSPSASAPPFVHTGIVLPAGSGISFDTDADAANPVPTANTDVYFRDYAGTPELVAAYSSDPLSPGLSVDYRTCSSADVFSQGVVLFGNLLYNGAVICYRNHGVVAAVTVHHVPGMYEPNMYITVDVTVWRGSGT